MAAPPMKSPLHDFPLTFLQWSTKNHRRHTSSPPPPPSSPPCPVGPRSSRLRRPDPDPEPEPEEVEVEKQWNLRPRRRCGGGGGGGGGGGAVVDAAERESGGGGGGCGGGGERREKRKFWIALSKDEIEEDIFSMTGAKPSRRPKKRPKIVQRNLDNVFPGLWLVGLTPDSYRNFDPPPLK